MSGVIIGLVVILPGIGDYGGQHLCFADLPLERIYVDGRALPSEANLLDVVLGTPPTAHLFKYVGSLDLVDETSPVILRARMAVSRRDLPSVIAVVAEKLRSQIAHLAMQKSQPFGDIRIDMPSKQHFFVKALNVEEVRALHQLKVAGPVIENGRRAQHHFVDVERDPHSRTVSIARRPSPRSRPSHKVSGISMRGA